MVFRSSHVRKKWNDTCSMQLSNRNFTFPIPYKSNWQMGCICSYGKKYGFENDANGSRIFSKNKKKHKHFLILIHSYHIVVKNSHDSSNLQWNNYIFQHSNIINLGLNTIQISIPSFHYTFLTFLTHFLPH